MNATVYPIPSDEMAGASASPSGSRPTDGAQEVSTLSGFDPSRKCECAYEGQLNPAYADWYDAGSELPYVNHAPGKCQCTNNLARYKTGDGAVRWLCSNCHTFADERLASAIEARSDATGTGAAEGESATAERGDAQ